MKTVAWALALTLLAGCATGPYVDDSFRAPAQGSRIRFLVIHYTHADFDETMRIMAGPDVSYHYVVRAKPPTIFRLVEEDRRANHAGVSSWRGYALLNDSSIGIAIVNRGPGETDGGTTPEQWAEYPEAQVQLVMELVRDIVKRQGIRPEFIVGHSDIAPQRKIDPGPRFPWKRLADAGLIKWPDAAKVAERLPGYERELPEIEWFQLLLRRHGFEVPLHGELDPATRNVVRAFQMKYRPAKHDGLPDAETAAILDALVNS